MVSRIKSLLGFREGERASARLALGRLARLEAAGEATEKDAKELDALLARNAATAEEYRDLAAALLKMRELEGEADNEADALQKLEAARAATAKEHAAFQKQELEHRERLKRLTAAEFECEQRHARSARAGVDLRVLKFQYADALGHEMPPLDYCTLLSPGGDRLEFDLKAPVVTVDYATYRAQSERRAAILEHEWQAAQAAHAAAWERYAAAIKRRGQPGFYPVRDEAEALEIRRREEAENLARANAAGVTRPPRECPRAAWRDVAASWAGRSAPEKKECAFA
ncbi:MAG: hypothetical protein M5U26_29225 [Planctomycetota bacterium]|nr:hypothetical protein [Planctomycetota bacterium]